MNIILRSILLFVILCGNGYAVDNSIIYGSNTTPLNLSDTTILQYNCNNLKSTKLENDCILYHKMQIILELREYDMVKEMLCYNDESIHYIYQQMGRPCKVNTHTTTNNEFNIIGNILIVMVIVVGGGIYYMIVRE
jgi:hypothetical protein